MKIKGIKRIDPVKVDLTEFFDGPQSVTVRPLPMPARAKLQELLTDGIRYSTKKKGKGLDVEAMEQSIGADAIMEIRRIKLVSGFVAHDFVDSDTGKPLDWNQALWDALDDADINILSKVVETITELTNGPDEDEKKEGAEDPT